MASNRFIQDVGRTPKDQTRTRRAIQQLRNLDLDADGETLQLTNGTLTVNTQGVLGSDSNGLKLNFGEAFENSSGTLTLKIANSSLAVDSSGTSVQLEPGGGIGLGSNGLKVVGGIPITTEQPTGTQDGSNTAFIISNPPQTGVVLVFMNGQLMFEDANGDYTRNNNTDIDFVSAQAPLAEDVLQAVYLEGQGAQGEVPAGTLDGTNDTFTLANNPEDTSLMLFANGQLLTAGGNADYTLSGTTITFNAAAIPVTGDRIFAVYEIEQ